MVVAPPKIIVLGPEEAECRGVVEELGQAGFVATLHRNGAPVAADLVILVGACGDDLKGMVLAANWGAPQGDLPWLPAQAPPNALRACIETLLGLGVQLREAGCFEWSPERTNPNRKPSVSDEQNLHGLEDYKDYFESTSDGIVVVDSKGTLLYMSHAAELLTGYRRDGVMGKPLTDLVANEDRERVAGLTAQAVAGTSPLAFDMQLRTVGGDPLVVSVSTSSALVSRQALIFVFRDVTEARALENELRKTKEFLERLIDSAVDGIVVADMAGNVLLFNKGAERIYGYTADEVVGKLTVEQLYPKGGARHVMAGLRSSAHGGPGRLELGQREILTRTGELVPVNMTAAMVYEEGCEIAMINIFSDLRAWLKMERDLHQVQEKLVETEKQALIAELAGTTAHELNQPLTSIMGYAELIRRQLGPDDAHQRAIDTIFRESERMAEIVRKIGTITRYETKTYVGSTQILDLEKSTG